LASFDLSGLFEVDASDVVASNEAAAESMEDVGDEAEEMGDEARGAARDMDKVGDEADDARNSLLGTAAAAQATSGALNSTSASVAGLTLSFNSLIAAVGTIGLLLGGLLAVLAPIVAAVGAFAAVLGSIGFTAFAGGMLAATQRTGTLKRQLQLLTSTITSEFRPVTEEATRVIVALASQFRPLIGQLVPAEQQISTIGDSFLTLGENVMDAIPPLVNTATTLTTTFLPGIADASGGLESFAQSVQSLVTSDQFNNFISNFLASARELAPEIKAIAVNLGGLTDPKTLKGITTLVDGFLDVLVVITAIVEKLGPLLEGVTQISSTFGGIGSSDVGQAGETDQGDVGDLAPTDPNNPYAASNRRGAAANNQQQTAVTGTPFARQRNETPQQMTTATQSTTARAEESENTGETEDTNIGEEIREALDTMDLALRGELDVSDNVASLQDVDARLERQVRNSRESGTGG